jgi:ATP-dependent DNA helicase RecQ
MTADPDATFRGDQLPVIDALVTHREKVLLVQRTGWGKSAVYFITAKLLREQGLGPTLIVSPLLALMRNQVLAGRRMGLRIGALHSGTADRFDTFVQIVEADTVDVLLVSPERFANPQFTDRLLPQLMSRIGLMVVDEAHCISDWGHDFRPDYQRLANLIAQLPPNAPLLATTATANDRVVQDVRHQLGDIRVSRGELARENLALQTMPTMTAAERFAWLAATIPTLPGHGIVYVLTKHDAERLATWLQGQGIAAHAYHADVTTTTHPDDTTEAKKELEERFTTGDLKVLIATTALGMGYDNPDIRFVIHYQAPGSIIAYYQQVGRAGRGRDGAVGILLGGPEDADIHESFRTGALPTSRDVLAILDALAKVEGATASQLMGQVNIPRGKLDHALRYLSVQRPAPIVRDGTTWRRTPVPWREDYVQHRDDLIALREREWAEMERYRRHDGCLMRYLLEALDDPAAPKRCGICANCLGESILPTPVILSAAKDPPAKPVSEEPAALGEPHAPYAPRAVGADLVSTRSDYPAQRDTLDPDLLHEAQRTIQRVAADVILPRKQITKGSLPVYDVPTRIPKEHLAEPGRTLGRIGDAAWGDVIAEIVGRDRLHVGPGMVDKTSGLTEAAAALIQHDWKPEPPPAWVTVVPSRRHPQLLPELASGTPPPSRSRRTASTRRATSMAPSRSTRQFPTAPCCWSTTSSIQAGR